VYKISSIYLIIFALLTTSWAQIDVSGSIDLELSYGGEDSKFVSNEIVNNFRKPHLGINQFSLFLFAEIDEDFFFNGRLQWNTWGTGEINPVRISLATLSWEPQDIPVAVSLGRFISPFGLYPKRQLASANLFVSAPLAYGYFVNISDVKGFWPIAGDDALYTQGDAGITTLYFGGYNTGGMLDWIIVEDLLNISLAGVNAAIASPRDYTNLQNAAFVGRLGVNPAFFWNQGFSLSYGSFFWKNSDNALFDKLERFTQLVAGADWVMAYSYFELSGEFIYSMWDVPGYTGNGGYKLEDGDLASFELTNYSYYVDLKYEPSFLTGSYIGFRYEQMVFEEFDHPNTTIIIAKNPWDDNITRYSASFGYKISRNILLKIAASDQKREVESVNNDDDFTIRSIIAVTF